MAADTSQQQWKLFIATKKLEIHDVPDQIEELRKSMRTFDEIIVEKTKNRPIDLDQFIDDGPLKLWCPVCHSTNVEIDGWATTLVGYMGRDGNHRWGHIKCKSCNLDCGVETKYESHLDKTRVWFVQRGKDNNQPCVIHGINGCYEIYNYNCNCDGYIKKVHRNKFDGQVAKSLGYGPGNNRTFRSFVECDLCGFVEEYER